MTRESLADERLFFGKEKKVLGALGGWLQCAAHHTVRVWYSSRAEHCLPHPDHWTWNICGFVSTEWSWQASWVCLNPEWRSVSPRTAHWQGSQSPSCFRTWLFLDAAKLVSFLVLSYLQTRFELRRTHRENIKWVDVGLWFLPITRGNMLL